jgi:hypothetical protein
MGRPKIPQKDRRMCLSVSLKPEILALAEQTANRSHFMETSVEVCRAVSQALGKLREGDITKKAFMEDVEDAVSIWMAEFDETVEHDGETA